MDEYLALPDGAGGFPQDFSGPVVLRNTAVRLLFCLQDYHLLWFNFPEDSTSIGRHVVQVLQPRKILKLFGLGCSLFARHYLGNRYCFLFLQVLRCFSSLG